MDEAKAISKIVVNLPKEKVDFINDTQQKELNYWKKIALENKNEDEKKQLTDLAPLRAFLARKDVVKNEVKNVGETVFYLKTQYLPHNEKQGITFIEDVPNQEDQFTFETIHLKTKCSQGARCQQQRKYSEVRKIEERIYLVNLKIGWRESTV